MRELFRQELHELGVDAAGGSGGDLHNGVFADEIEREPHDAGDDGGPQDSDEPGVAQEHFDTAAHQVLKRLHGFAGGMGGCRRERPAGAPKALRKPKLHGE